MNQPTLFECAPTFTNRRTAAVTFKGKMNLPIHRWYRLTPSFSPQLADDIADHFRLTAGDIVLDPFSGVGTVPLCMKYRGIPACSIELNPYLHFVGTVKTRTYTDLDAIEESFRKFMDVF
jgi:tRNA/tmRNA/rRNA uracil-C5-methylase (TrmA/RlmC/RlmD family)